MTLFEHSESTLRKTRQKKKKAALSGLLEKDIIGRIERGGTGENWRGIVLNYRVPR